MCSIFIIASFSSRMIVDHQFMWRVSNIFSLGKRDQIPQYQLSVCLSTWRNGLDRKSFPFSSDTPFDALAWGLKNYNNSAFKIVYFILCSYPQGDLLMQQSLRIFTRMIWSGQASECLVLLVLASQSEQGPAVLVSYFNPDLINWLIN